MFLRNIFIAAILALGLSGCSDRNKVGNEWTSLFNGTNLEGWTVNCIPEDKGKEYWKVTDGYIECNSMGDKEHHYVWLTSVDEFGDFHLKLKFQVFRESNGNSGVQFRSRYDDSDTARHGGWLNGPQCDIHGPNPMRAGLIYDETEGVRRWIYPSLPDWKINRDQVPEAALATKLFYQEDDPDMWNSLEIICQGMQVKTIVNDNQVTDFDGEGILNDSKHRIRKVGTSGFIAFQLHSHDELIIRFKEIVIKEL